MYHESILLFLVGVNIVLQSLKWYWDTKGARPLTSREFHFFTYDVLEKIQKILEDDSKQRRIEGFNQILSALDRHDKDNKYKQNKNTSNDK